MKPLGAPSPQHGPHVPAASTGRGGLKLKPAEVQRLRQAAQEFEAIFVQQMLKTARTSTPDPGPMASGASSEIYRDMVDQQLARSVSGGGGLGLGKLLIQSLVPAERAKASRPGPARPIQ